MSIKPVRKKYYTDKVKFIPLNCMTAYGGMDTPLHSFFILALDEGRWSSSYSCCTTLIPNE